MTIKQVLEVLAVTIKEPYLIFEENCLLYPKDKEKLSLASSLLNNYDQNKMYSKLNDNYYQKRKKEFELENKKYSLVTFNDITEYMSLVTDLCLDEVTGLNVRKSCDNITINYLKSIKEKEENFSIVFVDIDKFKEINDLYGHAIGDEILKFVANSLKMIDNYNENNIYGRLGGDEFMVILKDINSDKVKDIIRKICEIINKNYPDYIKFPVSLSCSFGIYNASSFELKDITNYEKYLHRICRKADKALYHSKENGRNRISVYDNHQTFKKLVNKKLA